MVVEDSEGDKMDDIRMIERLIDENASQRRMLNMALSNISRVAGSINECSKLSVDEVFNQQSTREEVLRRVQQVQAHIKTMGNILGDIEDTWGELAEWC